VKKRVEENRMEEERVEKDEWLKKCREGKSSVKSTEGGRVLEETVEKLGGGKKE
jgi:hypothetical protein